MYQLDSSYTLIILCHLQMYLVGMSYRMSDQCLRMYHDDKVYKNLLI